MYAFGLEWERCPEGVELFDYGQQKAPRRRQTLIEEETSPAGPTFRCKSARRFRMLLEAADLENPLIVRFVNARDDEARVAFFARFGFLYDRPNEHRRHDVLADQKSLEKLLEIVGTGEFDGAVERVNRILRKRAGDLTPRIDHTGRLSLHPRSLLSLMLMEAAMVVERGARLTSCGHCGKAFLTGATTGRRSHAIYCSDRCRVAAMRARNATGMS